MRGISPLVSLCFGFTRLIAGGKNGLLRAEPELRGQGVIVCTPNLLSLDQHLQASATTSCLGTRLWIVDPKTLRSTKQLIRVSVARADFPSALGIVTR